MGLASRSTDTSATSGESPVEVSQRSLIGLSTVAHGLTFDGLKIRARNGGEFRSPLLGRGMEFDEARLYQPGDDPRNIDWRITARTGKPYTKVFREERERPVLFLTDLRRSMHFATQGVYKSVLAAKIAATLAWVAQQNGDRIGGFLFSESYHRELKPRLGRQAVLRFIHELVETPVWNRPEASNQGAEDAAERALGGLKKVGRSGSLLIFVTDTRNLSERAISQLQGLAHNNDVLLFCINDPLETTPPPLGRYALSFGSDRREVSVQSRRQQEIYRQEFVQHKEQIRHAALKASIRFFELATTDDPARFLQSAFSRRVG
ncbi:MAG: DUF58 domain-containing protein [Pseudomonadota bacterium]